MITVKTLVLGDIYTNTYVVKDISSGELAVIDPATESSELIDTVNKLGGKLKYILLTHGHFDHIGGVKCLLENFTPEVCISESELELLNTPQLNGSAWHDMHIDSIDVDVKLCDGDKLYLGDTKITFIVTPGHTLGSGCFIVDDCIFSGDTLFCRSIGRTDFPTSSPAMMMQSLKKLAMIDGEYTVYPGHDILTTLETEKKYNPYLR